MRRSSRCYFCIIFFFLAACNSQVVVLPKEPQLPTAIMIPTIVSPTPKPTSTLFIDVATLLPTRVTVPIITPDSIHLERWKEYEDAIRKRILPSWTFEPLLCEWDILARSDQVIYVWALCGSSKGTDMRPAVIHIMGDGSVASVELAERGSSSDVDRMFPPEVQSKFIYYTGDSAFDGRLKEMLDHLYYREMHLEEPPLIVLLVRPITTPKP